MIRRLRFLFERVQPKSIDVTTAARLVLLTGIFLSPSFFDLGSVKPFDISKVAVLWVFGWLAFAITIVEAIRRELRIVHFRLATVAAFFLAAAGISTIFSRTRLVSFFGWYGRYNGFIQILLFVVVFWLVAQLYWRRPERLKEIFVAIAGASAVLTAYILIQWLGVDPIKWVQPTGETVFRYFGTMGNSNFAGGYLGATMGWLVFAFWRARRLATRLLVVGWAGITLFALWQTASRDGMVGAFVSGCVALFVFRRRLPRLVTIGAGALAVLIVVAGIGFALRSHESQGPRPAARVDASNPFRTGTLVVRTYWWRAALSIFADRPIVGAGPETFVAEYPKHALPDSSAVRGVDRTDKPHNVLLEHASSLGILGFGSYMALVLLAFRWGLRRMRAVEGIEQDLLGSFIIVASGYLGQGFFSIDVAALAALGWIAFGGIAVLADPALVDARRRIPFQPEEPARRLMPLGRRAAAAVAMVVLAAVVVAGLRPWLADRAAKRAQREASATSSTELVLASYRRAISLAPYDPVYRGLAANFLTRQAQHVDDNDVRIDLLGEAIEYEKEMDALHPGYAFWKITIGAGLGALGAASKEVAHFEEAEVWFADAAALAPYDRRVPLQHGIMLNKWGQVTRDGWKYCQAIEQFNRSMKLRPEVAAYSGIGQSYAAIGHLDEALAALELGREKDPKNKGITRLIDRVENLKNRKAKVKVITCPQ